MKRVIKASGIEEKFNSKKIYTTIIEAGGSKKIAKEALIEINKNYHKDLSTKEILKIVLKVLKKEKGVSEKYNLKNAIMSLGPSGFLFEQFFSEILKNYGYKTKINVFLKGKIITHEIDIIAEKNKKYMIECKYHNQPGKHTSLHPALYTYARFLDLKEPLDQPWLVTNTKCSNDAINYSKGVNLKITSWKYPQEESLLKLVDEKKLYPITVLNEIDNEIKEKLIKNKIILVKDLLNLPVESLSEKINSDKKTTLKIINEAKEVLGLN